VDKAQAEGTARLTWTLGGATAATIETSTDLDTWHFFRLVTSDGFLEHPANEERRFWRLAY